MLTQNGGELEMKSGNHEGKICTDKLKLRNNEFQREDLSKSG